MTNLKSGGGGKKRVRMRDVAQRCGVSISTVSLVLSGDTRIPEDTTQKVLQAVKALEYRPSVIARNLARKFSRTIGVIIPEFAFDLNQPFYYQALRGIHSHTQPAGFKMVVEAASKGFIERRYHHRLLKEQSADGVLFLAAGVNDDYLREMEKEPYPFILVGGYAKGVDLLVARSDDSEGAKLGTSHLIKLGHKNVGHLAGRRDTSYGLEREKGYMEAMKEAGLSAHTDWVVSGDLDVEKAEKSAKVFLDGGATAVFCASDIMAYGLLRGLKNLGKKVPTDMAASSWGIQYSPKGGGHHCSQSPVLP